MGKTQKDSMDKIQVGKTEEFPDSMGERDFDSLLHRIRTLEYEVASLQLLQVHIKAMQVSVEKIMQTLDEKVRALDLLKEEIEGWMTQVKTSHQ